MSVFLAVDLDEPTRAKAAAVIETHRGTVEGAKWLRIDKLHCTVLFLGNPTAEVVAGWIPKVEELARAQRPFSLRLQGAGTFVTARAPSVLWSGVTGELAALTDLHRAAASVFGDEPREFVPHVTLARARGAGAFEGARELLRGFGSDEFRVEGVSLYESSSEVYRVVHHSRFG